MAEQVIEQTREIVLPEDSQSVIQIQNQEPEETVDILHKFVTQSLQSIDKLAGMADRGSGSLLIGIGGILAFSVFFLTFFPNYSVEPTETVALIVLAGILMVGGTLARIYVYRDMSLASREIREFNFKIIEKSLEFSGEVRRQLIGEANEARRHTEQIQTGTVRAAFEQVQDLPNHPG